MGIKVFNPRIVPPTMTTAEKNALAAVEGAFVYDLTLHKLCVYTGAAWEAVTSV